MSLENYYSGDEHWAEFVKAVKSNPISDENRDIFCSSELHEYPENSREILEVACAYLGFKRMQSWLNTTIPALDGKTPLECIRGDNNLRNRLKEYLMRL